MTLLDCIEDLTRTSTYWCARASMMQRDLNHSQSVISQAILMLEDGDVDDAITALRNERDSKGPWSANATEEVAI